MAAVVRRILQQKTRFGLQYGTRWNNSAVNSGFSKVETDTAVSVNRQLRTELAAAYRLLNQYGLNEGVCNHLTAMAPAQCGNGDVMLVIPHGYHWSQVTASSLLGLNDSNEVVEGKGWPDITAMCIHRGIYNGDSSRKSVFHTHMPYATALVCLEDPTLLMIHQNSARFYNSVAYDNNYTGIATAFEEGERLSTVLADKEVLFMGNHGVSVTAPNISCAFDDVYYLERACMVQVIALSTGKKLSILPDIVTQHVYKQGRDDRQKYADAHFYGLMMPLKVKEPEFLD